MYVCELLCFKKVQILVKMAADFEIIFSLILERNQLGIFHLIFNV